MNTFSDFEVSMFYAFTILNHKRQNFSFNQKKILSQIATIWSISRMYSN